VGLLVTGSFTEAEALFASRLRAAASAETLRVGWETELAKVGAVRAIGEPATEPGQEGLVRVRVPVTCERGGLTVVMSVGDDGLLHGLRLAPPADSSWQPPEYAVPKRFTEEAVVLGDGPLAVPGTLTLPRKRGRWPGVVLLASGPSDRDVTTGPNKPFKDLAWGLASRGVAVVRFDKVTLVHPEVASAPGFTMVEEYVPHAIAAVRLLQQKASAVFVLGLSGGGKATTRVAAADPSIAGMVSLAGDTAPLPQAAVRIAKYLAELDPGPHTSAALEAVETQAERARTPEGPAGELLFGWPASYWRDLHSFDPVRTAAALDRPMLILQGGRDYQVTVADDLARWRAGLSDRPDVTIRVHDADDHLFFRGEGPSTPAAYGLPQHVDPAVVADIADWLIAVGRSRP
jgi:dienelactone hydrolase